MGERAVDRIVALEAEIRDLTMARSQAAAVLALIPDRIVRLDREARLVDEAGHPAFDPCQAWSAPDASTDERTITRLRRLIAQALASGALRTMVFTSPQGPDAQRVEVRVVPAASDQVLCIVRDVTDRRRAEQALADQVTFEALVTSISTHLISCAPADLDATIETGLGQVAGYFGADLAFIDQVGVGGAAMHRSHRWTRPGQEAAAQGPGVAASDGDLVVRFDQGSHVYARRARATDVDPGAGSSATDGAPATGQALAELRVRLSVGGALAGVLGLTWRTREPPATDEVLGLVRLAADAFHGAIRRRGATLLAADQATVFESIARGEPVGRSLLAVRDLLARHVIGAEVLIATVDQHELMLVSDEADDPLYGWFDTLPVVVGNPYGQAVVTGERVVVADAASDPRFGVRAVPDPRYRSVSVQPVRSSRDGSTLAVIVLLGEEPSPPALEAAVLASAVSLVAVALERDADARRLAHQATHDPLTGVGNRAALVDRLDVVLARAGRSGRPVAVLYCDLDGFKAINDEFGHDRGDALLVAVADRIRRAIRPSDTVSRTGGDEFVAVCEDLGSVEDAQIIAARIRSSVEDTPVVLEEVSLDVAVSVGVALADPVLDDPDRLLRAADLAMYENKQRARTGPVDRRPRDATSAGRRTLGGEQTPAEVGHLPPMEGAASHPVDRSSDTDEVDV